MAFPILLVHGVCRFDELWREALNVDNSADPDYCRSRVACPVDAGRAE